MFYIGLWINLIMCEKALWKKGCGQERTNITSKITPLKAMFFLLTVRNEKLAVISGKDLEVLVMLKNAHSSKLNYDVFITAEFPDQVQLLPRFERLKYFCYKICF